VNREAEGIEEGLWLMGLVTNSRVGLTIPILAQWERKPKRIDCRAVTRRSYAAERALIVT
jgi:hypothetical protein